VTVNSEVFGRGDADQTVTGTPYDVTLFGAEGNDILFERGIGTCHETVRLWWNRFGPMFAAEIRKRRVHHRSY
jgi:hypothetical protein